MTSFRFRIMAALGVWLAGLLALTFAQENPGGSKTLYLSVGRTIHLQMTTKKPIRKVFNERSDVAVVQPVPDDPTTVLVTGLAPGRTRITLTDVDGKKEVREMGPPRRKSN